MKLKIFSIFDIKAKVFSNPSFMAQVGQAIRAFSDMVNDDKTNIGRHPDDYKLYELGEYDDITGRFTSLEVPNFLQNATDLLITKK